MSRVPLEWKGGEKGWEKNQEGGVEGKKPGRMGGGKKCFFLFFINMQKIIISLLELRKM